MTCEDPVYLFECAADFSLEDYYDAADDGDCAALQFVINLIYGCLDVDLPMTSLERLLRKR